MKPKRSPYRRRPCPPGQPRSGKLRLLQTPDKRKVLLVDADMPKPGPTCRDAPWSARAERPWQRLHRQRGQALPEMLVITGALALLWLGVQQLSESRMAVLETAQASRRWAFALARAETPPPADRGLSLSVLKPAQVRDSAVSPSGQTLVSEWLDLPAHWAAVRAQAGPGMPARRTVLAAGAGHASDARMAQQRLGRSTHGWGGVADGTLRQARTLDLALRGLDRPWGQRRVHTDWLMPWADVVPAGRQLSRGRP